MSIRIYSKMSATTHCITFCSRTLVTLTPPRYLVAPLGHWWDRAYDEGYDAGFAAGLQQGKKP